MKQIHGKLTVDKVDETMYVTIPMLYIPRALSPPIAIVFVVAVEMLTTVEIGMNCASKTP